MNYDENLNLQSNLFSFLIHLSILFVMIFTVQWSPQYPYFGEVELWEALPTLKEQAQTPPKPKQAESLKIEKSTPKVSQQIKDTQAEINLKKKKEKELDNKEEIVHNDEHIIKVESTENADVKAGKKEYILKENAAKEVSIEDMIRNASPEALEIVEKELEREINTRKEKRNGWLDDLDK